MEAFIGTIMLFGGNFAPRSWALCQGQILSIAQNTALFSLLGTMYGGNGQTTFALPDLRGRTPIGFGQGPGLSNYVQGQVSGSETVTLTVQQLAAHNHNVSPLVKIGGGDDTNPNGKWMANATTDLYGETTTAGATMGASPSSNTGGSQPHNNMQPYLVLNYIICLEGIYPSRS